MHYFTLAECIRSATADAKGIDNAPNEEEMMHITESVETLLDPLREAWGKRCAGFGFGTPGIRVSSGFRGTKLNAAAGGSNTSAHCCGYAFDLIPLNGLMSEFKKFCCEFLADRAFDQLISEGENAKGIPAWMHIGYKSPRGEQRRQLLSMRGGKYYPMA